jgi:hypothetical protein
MQLYFAWQNLFGDFADLEAVKPGIKASPAHFAVKFTLVD